MFFERLANSGIAVVCLVVATLPPIAVYLHFKDALELLQEQIELYPLQVSDLLEENEILRAENEKLRNPILGEAYLVTELGWYLHNSSDPVKGYRNKLTVYGIIRNVGDKPATNVKLIINFYSHQQLLPQAEILIGAIRNASHAYVRRNVECKYADSVTKVEVERTWENMP